MDIHIDTQEVIIRERRLNSVLTYQGTAKDLCLQSKKKCLPCQDNSFNQCGDCSAQRAMLPISQIKDCVVVNHAPIGCAGDFSLFNAQHRRGLGYRNYEIVNVQAVSSNLEEHDTIYGGIEKLRQAIHEAWRRFQPKAIFITTSCTSGIIGDDVEEAVRDAEMELGIPIVPIYCEGFKSKIWTTGFDAGFHGILRKLVKPPRRKQPDIINIFNFTNELAFTPFLAKIGLKPRYFVQQASIEELETLSEAAASAHICETLGTYIAKGLEQEYGVPEVKAPPPYGLEWTDRWLREIGKMTGREEAVEKMIAEERERIAPALAELRRELGGRKVYVLAGASFGHSMLSIARDLGLEPVGITGFHHDQCFDNEDERLNSLQNLVHLFGDVKNYTVCNKQPYQIFNLLRTLRPDILMVRHDTMTEVGVKLGIPTFFASDANLSIGYDGVLYTGQKLLDVLSGQNYVKNIANHAKLPYTDWWEKQHPFHFREEQSVE